MPLKKSAVLVAAACAAMAGSANAAMTAYEINLVNDANANGRVVFIAGSSSVQNGFATLISKLFAGTVVRFANTTGSSRDFEAFVGTLAAGSGTWAGRTAIVVYRVKGGSVYGVNPVARNTRIESLVVNNTCGSATYGFTGSGTAAAPYTCATTGTVDEENTGVVPNAGVSDVAPVFFKEPFNTEGENPAGELNADELAIFRNNAGGSQTAIYGLSFGIAVTKNVPLVKITRSDVSAIFAGNVGNWSNLGAPAADIVVCRRVPGSGTQAVFNMWAGGFPCSADSNAPADRDASGAWNNGTNTFTAANGAGGLIVIENSTSGDVRTCLDRAVTGGTYATKDRNGDPVTVNFGTGGYQAIGTLSMDSLSSSKSGGNWQFRSLDGAGTITLANTDSTTSPVTSGTGKFPTAAVYENGDWDLQGWISFNIPGRTTGAKRELLDAFLNKAQDPAILAAHGTLKHVAMGIPTGGYYTGSQVLDAEYVNDNQCAPYNRDYND